MFARVTTIRGDADAVDEGVARYRTALSELRSMDGNEGAFLLIDRSSGKAVGFTLWSTDDAVNQSREAANRVRQQAADETGGQIESVEEFEVAVWEVDA